MGVLLCALLVLSRLFLSCICLGLRGPNKFYFFGSKSVRLNPQMRLSPTHKTRSFLNKTYALRERKHLQILQEIFNGPPTPPEKSIIAGPFFTFFSTQTPPQISKITTFLVVLRFKKKNHVGD